MKWLMLIGLTIVGLILLMVVIGLMLPKGHRATRMARFKQPAEAIFALIVGPQDWRGVPTTELSPGGNGAPRRWREQAGRHAITFEEMASEPPRLYRSRIADPDLPFSGTWTWEITPETGGAGGCVCRITEDGEVRNPVFRFVSQVILGHSRTIEQYLNAIGKRFGERVKIEP